MAEYYTPTEWKDIFDGLELQGISVPDWQKQLVDIQSASGGGGGGGDVTIVGDDVGLNKEVTQLQVAGSLANIEGYEQAIALLLNDTIAPAIGFLNLETTQQEVLTALDLSLTQLTDIAAYTLQAAGVLTNNGEDSGVFARTPFNTGLLNDDNGQGVFSNQHLSHFSDAAGESVFRDLDIPIAKAVNDATYFDSGDINLDSDVIAVEGTNSNELAANIKAALESNQPVRVISQSIGYDSANSIYFAIVITNLTA